VSGKPKRARAARRERQRELRKDVEQRERLAAAAPGGSPEHPIPVSSASVVEGRARSEPCPQCRGTLEVEAHDAEQAAGELLRAVRVVCRLCHVRRRLWFVVQPPLAN
jgi:hypothetical protein